ncbi:hypothetical protein GCM10022240_05120 [Microbacterium kribbense]|uniref:Uncharacterized protein n=1 Tax=Microbacterium kribbense TaxID=433645 RepID=A0ABP7G9T8_9MICO
MQKITVRREDFVHAVEKNRNGHRAAFEEALEGYRYRLTVELERRLRDVAKGRAIDLYFNLPEPQDHTDDYDRVLAMAQMSIDDEIELTEDEFGMYVMDQWDWKRSFAETTTLYGGGRR